MRRADLRGGLGLRLHCASADGQSHPLRGARVRRFSGRRRLVSVSVVYPGRAGAHTAAACDALFPADAAISAVPSFRAVAEAVAAREAAFGVLPIESSLVGPVAETHDLLYELLLSIVGQVVLPVDHCLVGLGPIDLGSIAVVHSHPVALDQCRRLLDSLPGATLVATPTTADAAHDVAQRGDPPHVAIASERAARLHGLTVLADNVGDH